INPTLRNSYIKKLILEPIVPTISASVSWLIFCPCGPAGGCPGLRTRRPVTYTVSVDCIPRCQPGLNFPPHAVRLASPHVGSCGSQAVIRYRPRLSRICDACWPSRRRSTVGTPLENWVDDAARLTKPDRVVYCDGSAAEDERIVAEMLRESDSETLNEKTYPNCYLHRSSPNDVARTEHLTFICTPNKDDVGPTNNWMVPGAAKHKIGAALY